MKTPTTLSGATETETPGTLSKLPKPVQSLMMATAIGAASLAASPEVQSATTVTMSTPTLVTGTQEMWSTPGASRVDSYKEITEIQSNLQIHVTNDAPTSIVFTVNGFLGASTGVLGSGTVGTMADVNAEVVGGVNGGPTISLAQLDGPAFMNVGLNQFNSQGEGFDVTKPFSYSWTLPSGASDINLSLLGHSSNSTSSVSLSGNGNVDYPIPLGWTSQPIPEASTTLLAGAALTLLALRRKRETEENTK